MAKTASDTGPKVSVGPTDEAAAYRFLGDQPYTEPDDPLGYDHLVDRLGTLIARSRSSTPFVIGIEGPWGVGKSSVMLKLQKRLRQDGVRTVYYNAWNHEGRRGATEALLKTVLAALDEDILQRWMRFDRNQKWKRWSVTLLRVPVVALAARLGLGNAVDKVWDRLEKRVQVANDFQQRFSDAMGEWSTRNPAAGEPGLLGVFIDDLDRCSDKSVVEMLTAVKLYLTVARCIFVIGYDRMAVDELIHRRIAESKVVKGSMYLEKMIQVPFSIPQPNPDAARACLEQYLEEAQVAWLFGGSEDIIIKGTDGNPRKMKRFINVFLLRWMVGEATGAIVPPELLGLLLLLNLHDRGFSFLVERDFAVVDRFSDYVLMSRALDRVSDLTELADDVRSLLGSYLNIPRGSAGPSEPVRDRLRAFFPASFQGYCQDERLCDLVLSTRDAASGVPVEAAERAAKVSQQAAESAVETPPTQRPLPESLEEYFEALPSSFLPQKAGRLDAVIQFMVTGRESGEWVVTIRDGKCTVAKGKAIKPNLTINTPSEVWLRIQREEVDAPDAFMKGEFTFTGDMGILMQMGGWFGE